jgi:hypothetical protein
MIRLRETVARLVKHLTNRSKPTEVGASTEASSVPENGGTAKPKLPRRSVSKLIRSRVISRVITAYGETRLLLILAAFITAGSGLWAWSLATIDFAAPPKLVVPPGIIGAAIESSGRSVLTPIDVQANYNPATDHAGTNLELVFTQIVAASASKMPSPTVIVFFCGSIAQHPDLLNYRLRPVRWKSPTSPDGVVQSSTFGFLSQCIYTTLPMRIVGPPGEYRQALLTGSSGTAPTDTSSGTKVLYALPGIANWSFPVPIDGLMPAAMPRASTLTVNLNQDPTDLENMFASPQLPDAGSLTWKSKIDVYAPPVVGYRLEADSLTAVSRLQLHLFIAGAFVGVAGGAFMWFVQLVGQAGYGAAASRAKRTKAPVDQGSSSATAEHEVPGPATHTSSEPGGAGLGWPSASN